MGTNRPSSLMGSLGLSLRELVRVLGTKPQYRASGQDNSVSHPRMAFQSPSHLALHQSYLCNLYLLFGSLALNPEGSEALHICSLAQSPLSQGIMSLGLSGRVEIPAWLTGAFL